MGERLDINVYFSIPEHQVEEFLNVLREHRKFAIGSNIACMEFELVEE
jgi:hypothetical protein